MNAPAIDPRLGSVVREYGGAMSWRMRLVMYFAVPVMLLGAVGITALFISEPPNDAGDFAGVVFLELCLLALPIVFIVVWAKKRNLRAALHEHGLRAVNGPKSWTFLWPEVDSFKYSYVSVYVNGIPTGTNAFCEIAKANGEKLKMDHWLKDVQALAKAIDDATFVRRKQLAFAAFQAGQPVPFGDVVADRAGLRVKNAFLPWPELKSIHFGSNYFRILKKGKTLAWKTLPTFRVANAAVLVALAQQNITS